MCLSIFLSIIGGLFGSSAATAVGGAIATATTAIASVSATQALATVGTITAAGVACDVVSKISDKTRANNNKAIQISRKIINDKRTAEKRFTEQRNNNKKRMKNSTNAFNKQIENSCKVIKSSKSLVNTARKKLNNYKKGKFN